LNPHTSFGVKGWRKNMQRTAAFFFTELENSYAARTDRPTDVGVIGVAVFRKKAEPPVAINRYLERRRPEAASDKAQANEAQNTGKDEMAQGSRDDAAAPRSAAAGAVGQPSTVAPGPEPKKLGTGHGQSETSVVRYTNFERASSNPDEVITIYYDSYRNLVAQGVIRENTRLARPNPFPGQFVADPR
jgi:hypothetical protein